MSDSKKKILEMLAKNKINADEAYRLLSAVDTKEGVHEEKGRDTFDSKDSEGKSKHKYLRVTITPPENQTDQEHPERVNVRVPMSLIRAGIKLTSLIPPEAMDKANKALNDKGINFDIRNMKSEDIEGLIDALGDMQVDIEGGKGEKVKVFVE
jgi:hypothetical protein